MDTIKSIKKIVLIFIDIQLIILSYLSSFYFIAPNSMQRDWSIFVHNLVVITSIYIICFYLFRLYESLWIYASMDEFIYAAGACMTASIITIIYRWSRGIELTYNSMILAGVFSIIYIVIFRLSFRISRRAVIHFNRLKSKDYKRVMIVGAGSAGTMVINEMKHSANIKYKPVALIDDNVHKLRSVIAGVKVVGDRNKINEVIKQKKIEEIIIAIPSIKGNERKEIINICQKTGCKVKTIPGISELIEGKVSLAQIREVQVEDLLGRETIDLDSSGIKEYIKGKTVMVTGGGGSIGSELCRQIAKFMPKALLILDIYENNAYDLQNELKVTYPHLNQKVIIACVKDKRRLEMIFNQYKPEVVFHAAAHKHVPLMEDNPGEAIKNNVFGTLNVTECADRYGVKKFVMISTDKAVNPTNIMGASKRVCEMIVQAMDKVSQTEFVAVRFGNVLGSNGSVIPLFKKQIANGGPITLTHKEITRFFMTIPEASQLVLQAGAFAKGGEIFVLDMGMPVKIYDLACDLIRLSGLEPEKDIKIKVTGLRPGEKLYEELLMAEEGLSETKHKKIFVGSPMVHSIEELMESLGELREIIEKQKKEEIFCKVEEIVPTYRRLVIDKVAAARAD